MIDLRRLGGPTPTPAEARALDELCDRFEQAHRAGKKPLIEDYLVEVSPSWRARYLRELLVLDWELRRTAGEKPTVLEYRGRFPEFAPVIADWVTELTAWSRTEISGDTSLTAPRMCGGDQAAPTQEASPASNRYMFQQEIGKGGIGIVYRARDRRLGRDLAVKILQRELADRPDLRRHFVAEAQIGSQLQHPGIAPVY